MFLVSSFIFIWPPSRQCVTTNQQHLTSSFLKYILIIFSFLVCCCKVRAVAEDLLRDLFPKMVRTHLALMRRASSKGGGGTLTLRYEALLGAGRDQSVRDLLRFVGLGGGAANSASFSSSTSSSSSSSSEGSSMLSTEQRLLLAARSFDRLLDQVSGI